MENKIFDVNDSSFENQVINYFGYVIVYFWADWCGSCRSFNEVFCDVHKNFSKKLKFVKINIDFSKNIVKKYNIKSIPNLILFNNGIKIFQKIGFFTKSGLIEFLSIIKK